MEDNGYIEIETPVLIDHPSGATARPFVAHHNALDMDVYLRIAPETYLKRAIVGGFTKVFEFARCFRNEGMDTTHLQDFTMLEGYCAYYNYRDNMRFLQDMLQTVITKIRGSAVISINGTEIDFGAEWAVVTFRELILKDAALTLTSLRRRRLYCRKIESRHIELNSTDDPKKLGRRKPHRFIIQEGEPPEDDRADVSHCASDGLGRAGAPRMMMIQVITDRFQLVNTAQRSSTRTRSW